ncbi:hypothetical protein ES319_A09G088800v1 [Gossypium barbadense]|uniref:Uncharacterized protein n=2 Tax=Gossypium TaxID=3633 RepID=A0A5J5UCG3_GOSBA|nr:hypothetical protein ES319_A09G088800v1 [Gossypium barbadense]TYI09897.1 hypothetical protein ES332_A09G103100v1 [Gossypium tomentosum]
MTCAEIAGRWCGARLGVARRAAPGFRLAALASLMLGFLISFFVLLVFGLGFMWACVLFCIWVLTVFGPGKKLGPTPTKSVKVFTC